jgi:hypothetical protein
MRALARSAGVMYGGNAGRTPGLAYDLPLRRTSGIGGR